MPERLFTDRSLKIQEAIEDNKQDGEIELALVESISRRVLNRLNISDKQMTFAIREDVADGVKEVFNKVLEEREKNRQKELANQSVKSPAFKQMLQGFPYNDGKEIIDIAEQALADRLRLEAEVMDKELMSKFIQEGEKRNARGKALHK